MNRSEKEAVIDQLTDRLSGASTLYLTDFSGVAVKPMTELRRKLRSEGVEYLVVKNTLALRALQAASVSGVDEVLNGPTAFVFAGEDPVTAAKILTDFQKEHNALTVKAGLVDGRTVSADEVKQLATLPSREQLLIEAGAALQAPLQGFVGALHGVLYQMVGALEALRTQRSAT